MIIRTFHPADSNALAALFFQTIRQVNSQDYSQEQVEAWAPENWNPEEWLRSFDGKFTFVAEESGSLLGFGELEPNGHIDRFYISASAIGKGVGRAIYERLETEARERKIPRLFVEASITAKPFFEKMGFTTVTAQIVSRRGVNFDNFVMEKILT